MSGSGRGDSHSVVIASNRGPLAYVLDIDGELTARRGSGGLVSGLTSALAGRDGAWVCAALSTTDRMAVGAHPGGWLPWPHGTGPDVRMLAIDPSIHGPAYNGVANSVLWFVHHMLFPLSTQPVFDSAFAADWQAYRTLNERFATATAEACDVGATAFVQDYHLALVPALLRARRPDLRVAHFTHTPWAPPEYFRVLPEDVRVEIVDGMLGADVLGFHTRRWAAAFLACCEDLLGPGRVDWSTFSVEAATSGTGGRRVRVLAVAPGIDAAALRARARRGDVASRLSVLQEATDGLRVVVRSDRIDPSKNAVRGLLAYRELLHTVPEWQGHVVHVAMMHASRSTVPAYQEYSAAVVRAADQIWEEFSTPGWNPLILSTRDDYANSLAGFRQADVLLVNPIRDGLNLVAMEGPVLADRGVALVLSTEAGAAETLTEARLLNPYDVTETAEALDEALRMPDEERLAVTSRLVDAAAAVPPGNWLTRILASASGG